MKTILITLTALISLTAYAEGVTPISSGDISLSEASSRIISVTSTCPKSNQNMNCFTMGAMVSIQVTLGGCLDRLGGHFSSFEVVDGKGVLHFGAINIFNKASRTARCIVQNSEIVNIYVPFEGEIELKEMNYDGSVKPLR
jgi:hypothetical protein